jgi:hypothetical protein
VGAGVRGRPRGQADRWGRGEDRERRRRDRARGRSGCRRPARHDARGRPRGRRGPALGQDELRVGRRRRGRHERSGTGIRQTGESDGLISGRRIRRPDAPRAAASPRRPRRGCALRSPSPRRAGCGRSPPGRVRSAGSSRRLDEARPSRSRSSPSRSTRSCSARYPRSSSRTPSNPSRVPGCCRPRRTASRASPPLGRGSPDASPVRDRAEGPGPTMRRPARRRTRTGRIPCRAALPPLGQRDAQTPGISAVWATPRPRARAPI